MLRRPPTAISLRPSDVAEMADLIASKKAAAAEKGKGKEVGDALLEKEGRERREKEGKGQGGRVGV